MSPPVIEDSFRNCCISNALDSTEDNVIGEEESYDDTDEDDEFGVLILLIILQVQNDIPITTSFSCPIFLFLL